MGFIIFKRMRLLVGRCLFVLFGGVIGVGSGGFGSDSCWECLLSRLNTFHADKLPPRKGDQCPLKGKNSG